MVSRHPWNTRREKRLDTHEIQEERREDDFSMNDGE